MKNHYLSLAARPEFKGIKEILLRTAEAFPEEEEEEEEIEND
jgi:hypothetical protein